MTRSDPPEDPTPTPAPAGTPAGGGRVDVSGEAVHWDLERRASYGGYLGLDQLLAAQHPRSTAHDEMLFVIVHQASELWMKLCLHELRAAIDCVRRDDLDPCFKMLSRVARIQTQLVHSWDVLATMTPSDYESFREALGPASGFQSWQYRTLEFLLGNKNADLVRVHRRAPDVHAELESALHAPGLYDEALRLLARRGFAIPAGAVERDFSLPYVPSEQVVNAWLRVYRSVDEHWDLYELAEKLIDLDHQFQLWRFSHLKTVERIIGFKRGTGGTGGASYLAKALDLRFFPELWSVRTSM